MTHLELCKQTAERFVQGKSFALYEVTMQFIEQPDVLVFDSSGHTTLYEIKMSHSDFMADKTKHSRKFPQFGERKFYVCSKGIIQKEELPTGWGLYWLKNNKFYKQADSILFKDIPHATLNKNSVYLLSNQLITQKERIVFSKRVLENRKKFAKRKAIK